MSDHPHLWQPPRSRRDRHIMAALARGDHARAIALREADQPRRVDGRVLAGWKRRIARTHREP